MSGRSAVVIRAIYTGGCLDKKILACVFLAFSFFFAHACIRAIVAGDFVIVERG